MGTAPKDVDEIRRSQNGKKIIVNSPMVPTHPHGMDAAIAWVSPSNFRGLPVRNAPLLQPRTVENIYTLQLGHLDLKCKSLKNLKKMKGTKIACRGKREVGAYSQGQV